MEQFKADFKTVLLKEPSFEEYRAFQKFIVNEKEKAALSSLSSPKSSYSTTLPETPQPSSDAAEYDNDKYVNYYRRLKYVSDYHADHPIRVQFGADVFSVDVPNNFSIIGLKTAIVQSMQFTGSPSLLGFDGRNHIPLPDDPAEAYGLIFNNSGRQGTIRGIVYVYENLPISSVTVQTKEGKSAVITANAKTPVSEVIAKASVLLNMDRTNVLLLSHGEWLLDVNVSLVQWNIKDAEVLVARARVPKATNGFSVHVICGGLKFTLEVEDIFTVDDLKLLLEETHEMFPPSEYGLIFAGKYLEKGQQLKEYGIKDGDRKSVV